MENEFDFWGALLGPLGGLFAAGFGTGFVAGFMSGHKWIFLPRVKLMQEQIDKHQAEIDTLKEKNDEYDTLLKDLANARLASALD